MQIKEDIGKINMYAETIVDLQHQIDEYDCIINSLEGHKRGLYDLLQQIKGDCV